MNQKSACQLFLERSNLVFLKTYNTSFDKFIMTLTNQNGRPLEIEDKGNFTRLANNQKRCDILQKQEQENMLKDIDFYHLLKIYSLNMKNNHSIQDQRVQKLLQKINP